MNSLEQAPAYEEMPDFGMDFEPGSDFDINAAFQETLHGVATDNELAVEEKVRRMEVIVSEGTSEVYRDFVDFRQMAAQMEVMCMHDHSLNQATQGSETLSGFMDSHNSEDGHSHSDSSQDKHGKRDDEYETDPKTGKKKKKKQGWFGVSLK
jgi:hypothetical protein